jgi:hypothetical protein
MSPPMQSSVSSKSSLIGCLKIIFDDDVVLKDADEIFDLDSKTDASSCWTLISGRTDATWLDEMKLFCSTGVTDLV